MTTTHSPEQPPAEPQLDAAGLFSLGNEALTTGNTAQALEYFTKGIALERNPLYLSSLAFCLAKQKAEFAKGISLCKEAVKHDPKNVVHFLFLGKIHLLEGKKNDAIRIFRLGLRIAKDPALAKELNRLGCRTSPVIPFLARSNPLNKYLGILLKKYGYR
jgi:tetratricopeptide (TPR) repeat protein